MSSFIIILMLIGVIIVLKSTGHNIAFSLDTVIKMIGVLAIAQVADSVNRLVDRVMVKEEK